MAVPFGLAQGTVEAFDDHAGEGTVRDADGTWYFHCTTIADRTRTIPVGTAVSFRLLPGHHGRWEAADLVS